jgi:ADP-glucose pyrophosphorylase
MIIYHLIKNQIITHIINYYKNLLGLEDDRLVSLNPTLWEPNETLIIEMSCNLEKKFLVDEIKKVIFEFNENKASGPYELSFHFYQRYWEIIKKEIFILVNAFYNHNLDLTKINLAIITLVPKNI